MQIEIKLLTQLKQYLPDPDLAGNSRFLDIAEPATVREVLEKLGVPVGVNPENPYSMFQVVAPPCSNQPNSAEPEVILPAVKFFGLGQVGAMIIETLSI